MPTTTNVVNKIPVITGTANKITVVNAANNATSTLSLASTVVNNTQPLFVAYNSVTDTNATGNGAVYTILYDTVVVNQPSGTPPYNSASGTFTAPITGRYLFNMCTRVLGAATATSAQLNLVTTAGTYVTAYYGAFPGLQDWPMNGSAIVPMTAGDTAKMQLTMTGAAANTAAVRGSGSPYVTFFCGTLLPA